MESDTPELGEKKILKRAPAVSVRISELKENMGRVAIAGTVIDKNPDIGSFMLDDSESSVLVLAPTNDPTLFDAIKEGQFVRVLGKVWGSAGEIEIQAEIIQDFSKIDKELYKKVMA
ncbi:MAG: hypothetical protein V1839_03470 [archaeon]